MKYKMNGSWLELEYVLKYDMIQSINTDNVIQFKNIDNVFIGILKP